MSTPTNTPAVASPKRTFQDLVDGPQFKEQIARALPKHLTPERFVRVLMTAALKTPKLFDCSQESVFRSVFDLAAAGLEADGRRAALVPLKNNKKGGILECNAWIMYQGVAELVMRSGLVSNIHTDLICDKDEFESDRGVITKHKIDYRKPRGEPYAAYCIIRMRDGSEKAEVMSADEIEHIRKASPGADADPWRLHWGEMARKTVFKRAAKWLPLSPEIRTVIESERDDEPINITARPGEPTSLMAALTDPPPPEAEKPVPEQPGDEKKPEEAKAPPPAAEEKAKAVPEKKATPAPATAHDPALIDAVEGYLLDLDVSLVKAIAYAREQKWEMPEKVRSMKDIPAQTMANIHAWLGAQLRAKQAG